MNSRDVLKALLRDGWYEVNQVGSHKQFKHPVKNGRVTVPYPKRDIPIGTLKSIEKQAESNCHDGGSPARIRNHGLHCLSPQGPEL
jgi:predicted RNA binding protein YcfA (HicA-like mRNA interferase family)